MTPAGATATALPRLLAGMPASGAMDLAAHLELHGEPPLGRRAARGLDLIELIDRAGLRGCGGAAFPAATKLRAVAHARGRPVVVANGAEGEPASVKDRVLLEALPNLVLDGAVLAAEALGARDLIVCLPSDAEGARASLAHALEQRHRHWREPRGRVVAVPDTYIAGEETALVSLLNGGPAKPTFTPPRPFERGVGRRPTLVQNVETLAHIALIARYGDAWFRELGTAREPGSRLVTLAGAVGRPGVYEIEHGTALAGLLEAAGGAIGEVRAVLVGGYFGAWLAAEAAAAVSLDDEHLARHGCALGAGVVFALSREACGVAETARIAAYLAEQSSGQCGPCINGLGAIAHALARLVRGVGGADGNERLLRWLADVDGRGACGHPDGAVRFVESALNVFADEFADHVRRGPCAGCARPPELPLPAEPSLPAGGRR